MARRTTPQPKPADWPPSKTYAALKKQLTALVSLRGRRYEDAEHDENGWSNLTLNILAHGFGENSNNVDQFHQAKWAGDHYVNMSDFQIQANFEKRIEAFGAMLNSSLAELELIGEMAEAVPAPIGAANSDSRNVFVVHGRDEAVRESVARFLDRLDLTPIILLEQPNKGQTIIEKFEANADVGFAVVLLTPDDVGGLAGGELKPRARQNVILELGYFIGKLGRGRVCALHSKEIEVPSDIHGVLYVPYDDGGGWRLKLAYEIKAAGITIDMNKI